MRETIAAYVIPPLRSALEFTVGPKHIVQPVENERSVRLPIIIIIIIMWVVGGVRKEERERGEKMSACENKLAPRRRSAAACPFPNNDVTHRL